MGRAVHTVLVRPGRTCLSRSPCYGGAESVAALRTLSWVAWAGLLLVVAGVALSARALPSTPGHTLAGPSRWGTPSRLPGSRAAPPSSAAWSPASPFWG